MLKYKCWKRMLNVEIRIFNVEIKWWMLKLNDTCWNTNVNKTKIESRKRMLKVEIKCWKKNNCEKKYWKKNLNVEFWNRLWNVKTNFEGWKRMLKSECW